MQLADQASFRLGAMDVRPPLREVVWPDGLAILQPRAMKVLVMLANSRGAVVSRDRLVSECWDSRAVGNDSINRVLHLLRQLSEQSRGCGFSIQTVARVGYRLISPGPEATVSPARSAASPPLLAVLAFDDLTDDPQLGYFSDGVSEEILHSVSRTVGVRVVGRSSSFALRGADKSAARVAELLGASHVLDGSVRRGADRVRVSAELMETATQTTLWSGQFDRPLTDVLVLQDDIAGAVAQALNLAFSRDPDLGPIDPVAFDLYLRARGPIDSRLLPDIELLEQATARAPSFSAAWALLAYARAIRTRWGAGQSTPDRRADVISAAKNALALNPRAGPAYLALSTIEPLCGAFARQREITAKALAVAPHDVLVLSYAGGLDDTLGFQRRALGLIAQAYESDPREAGFYFAYLLNAAGRAAEAKSLCDRDLTRFAPAGAIAAVGLRMAAEAGEWERYDSIAAAARPALFTSPLLMLVTDLAQRLRGWSAETADVALETLRREAVDNDRTIFALAGLLAARGRTEAVWEILDTVSFTPLFSPEGLLAPGELGLNVLFSPTCRALREDPRFVGLCARLGLVDFWAAADEWPDCVAETAPLYDFKAEALRHIARRGRQGRERDAG